MESIAEKLTTFLAAGPRCLTDIKGQAKLGVSTQAIETALRLLLESGSVYLLDGQYSAEPNLSQEELEVQAEQYFETLITDYSEIYCRRPTLSERVLLRQRAKAAMGIAPWSIQQHQPRYEALWSQHGKREQGNNSGQPRERPRNALHTRRSACR